MGEGRRSYLIDTDFFIDWLKGMPWAKQIMGAGWLRLYYSNRTRKELLQKEGLRPFGERLIYGGTKENPHQTFSFPKRKSLIKKKRRGIYSL